MSGVTMSGVTMSGVTVPPRKRRRPALSCIECRRRKIKCDRNMPCNHCMQSRNSVCSYKDSYPPSRHGRSAPRTPPTPLSTEGDFMGKLGHKCPNLRVEEEHSFGVNSLSGGIRCLEDRPQSEQDLQMSTSASYTDTSPTESSEINRGGSSSRGQNEHQVFLTELTLNASEASKENVDGMSMMGINFSTFEDVMIQDGDSRNTLRTKVFRDTHSTPILDLKGTLCKTRFFGQSHWMFALKQFPPICRFKDSEGNLRTDIATTEVRGALEKCKRMARAAKAERPIKWHTNPNFKDYIPSRKIADKLLDLYFRTGESCYRILHIPSFKQEYEAYWYDPASASTMTAVKIVLVMAIGTCFYQEEGNEELRSMAQQWVYSAQSWTASPFEKSRLNLNGMQVHCLLVLARQTIAVGGDLIWPAAGTLLRTAFSMGFHRDPKNFPKVPIYIAEMRRRLWATALEMAIQTSLEAGMPPLIASDDWDTEPPLNIHDESIWEGITIVPRSEPINVCTRTAFQIILVKSQRTRLRVVHLLNKFQAGPTYEEILVLDQNITGACNEAGRLMRVYAASEQPPTALQRNLLDIFIRRYLLHIHMPFSVQSKVEPRYYYSRKVCLEAALTMFFHSGAEDLPAGAEPHIQDDYTRLKVVGGGVFKDLMLHAATVITIDLIVQLEDDIKAGLPPSMQRKVAREPLYQAVQDIITLTAERIRQGENNAKGHLFLSAAAAQIQAMTNGQRPEDVVPEAAKQSALHCLELLTARAKLPPITPPDSDPGTSGSRETESLEDPDYAFGMLMPDANLELDIPDSWVFTGWEMS